MSPDNVTDMSSKMQPQEERITEAFNDLARRANAVDVDHGPHVAGAGARAAGGGRGPLLPALAFAVIAAVAGFGGWRLLAPFVTDNDPDTNIATEDVLDNEGDGDTDADAVDGFGARAKFTEVDGVPDTPFLLIETDSGTRAGFGSDEFLDLPADAQDALPDGEGGVFYTAGDEVIHQRPGGEPTPMITSTISAQPILVSARMVEGRQAVLVNHDDDLIAIFADRSMSTLSLGDLGLEGTIVDVAMDGSTVAAIVDDGDSVSVQVVSQFLSTDDAGSARVVWTAVASIEPDHRDAPHNVALAGDLLVVGTAENVHTYTIADNDDSATPGPSYPLPAYPDDSDWWTFDASGDDDFADLIIGFGESALTIDLNDGTRRALSGENMADAGSDGWIRSAHWGFDPHGVERVSPDGVAGEIERYQVNAAVVAADPADPFLNVRSGPGTDFPVVAKLPPNYRGVVSRGDGTVTDDGALWIPIGLLQPVEFTLDPAQQSADYGEGWVNLALLEPLVDGIAVGTDEVPACRDGEYGQLGGTMSGEPYLYGLESTYLSENCLRVVVSFGQGQAPIIWEDIPGGTGPAAALPSIQNPRSGGYGSIVDLGTTQWAWPDALQTEDEVYIARGSDGGLELVAPMRVDSVNVTALPEQGMVVVDLDVAEPPVVVDRFVVLTEPPLIGAGSISVNGIARPFEATLGVSVVDADNNPVTAVFSGSTFLGSVESDQYGVSTTDWTAAWGQFSVKVDGLEPGSYTMVLDGEGGADVSTPTRFAFTVTDASTTVLTPPDEAEARAAAMLVDFARGNALNDVPLADEVTLSLGLDEQIVRTRDELADRDNWVFDVADGFGGFDGPFSVLDTLSGSRSLNLQYSAGSMPFCAGPAKDWPADWQALDQVNIEPIGIDSCIAWFGVSLFFNADDEIEVIVLDLFGP